MVNIKGIQMDAAYFTPNLMKELKETSPRTIVVTQMRSNQNVVSREGEEISVGNFFSGKKPRTARIKIRGGKEQKITYCSGRLSICSHGKKYRVVAMKYEGERDYRYLVSDELSWRPEDVVEYYSLRWLVETFFEDWKAYEGWARLAYQQGVEGSRRGVILSLLLDHSLLFHPEQKARLECHRPIVSVGSLRSAILADCFIHTIEDIALDPHPHQKLELPRKSLTDSVLLRNSTKHMSGTRFSRSRSSPEPRPPSSTHETSSYPTKMAA